MKGHERVSNRLVYRLLLSVTLRKVWLLVREWSGVVRMNAQHDEAVARAFVVESSVSGVATFRSLCVVVSQRVAT